MIDNLFVVESPLQALVAVELSLRFKSEKNGVVYRLLANREKNNHQIEKVVKNGNWSVEKKISFNNRNVITSHTSVRKELINLEKEFKGNVKQLFIGEFRSQWMHFMRAAICPRKTILIDDGAATLTLKRKYIDKGIFFPTSLWEGNSTFKEFIKKNIYRKFLDSTELKSPILFASAFLKSESVYTVDFSELKKIFKSGKNKKTEKRAFFFGSKYSEAKIVSLEYELSFIKRVKEFYSKISIDLVYCAHRDESSSKLSYIQKELKLEVVSPEMPAEIFLLEEIESVAEIAGAYSSVLNNMKIIFSDIVVRAFELKPEEINIKNREDIFNVYKYYKAEGIKVEPDGSPLVRRCGVDKLNPR